MMASARGVAIKVKQQTPKNKMVVFSAAQENETAYPFKTKQHGLFTYFLLKNTFSSTHTILAIAKAEIICLL